MTAPCSTPRPPTPGRVPLRRSTRWYPPARRASGTGPRRAPVGLLRRGAGPAGEVPGVPGGSRELVRLPHDAVVFSGVRRWVGRGSAVVTGAAHAGVVAAEVGLGGGAGDDDLRLALAVCAPFGHGHD